MNPLEKILNQIDRQNQITLDNYAKQAAQAFAVAPQAAEITGIFESAGIQSNFRIGSVPCLIIQGKSGEPEMTQIWEALNQAGMDDAWFADKGIPAFGANSEHGLCVRLELGEQEKLDIAIQK